MLQAGETFCRLCGVRSFDPEAAAEQAPTPAAVTDPGVAPAPAVAVAPPVTPVQPVPMQPYVPMHTNGNGAVAVAPAMMEAPPKTIRLRGRHMAAISSVIALIVFAAAAAGAFTAPKPKPAGELVGSLPFGPEGGTKAFDNGAGKIKVPKGALDGQRTIEVRRTIVRERVTAQSPTGTPLIFPPGALIAYTFGPITLVFNRPITITLTLPPGQGGLVFVTANGQINFFPGTVNGQRITIRLNSLDLQRPGAIVAV
jgi:hypothetical protein